MGEGTNATSSTASSQRATSWRDRANELLYDGETVRETVDVDGSRVCVTSHRVLAFFPEDAGGANFRQVDLPNVEGVAAGSESDRRALATAVAWAVGGVPLLVGGVVFEFGDLLPAMDSLDGQAAGGAGGAVSLFQSVFAALALLDEAVALVGALLCVVAAAYAVRYARSRERVVRIEVAGDRDVDLRVDAGEESYASDLRDALDA